ncbi:hypothetical protein LA080_003165 [Diaporthe eres]|nr:hypothetical protein LA080_003165 [Diaporthe eres]
MPFLRAEAPPHVPGEETIEYLLGEDNNSTKRAAKISPLQDLEPDVRQRTGLITLGKLKKRIQGDPWGYYFSWAGNVCHPDDMRVHNIVVSLCKKLQQYNIQESDDLKATRQLLEMVPTTDVVAVAKALAEDGDDAVLADNDTEIVVTFRIGSKAVRLMQAKDVDVDDPKSYGTTQRAASSAAEAKQYTRGPPMTVELQQDLMALAIVEKDEWKELNKRKEAISLKQEELQSADLGEESRRKKSTQLRKDTNKYNNHCVKFFLNLRDATREDYWLLKTPVQREQVRNASQSADLAEDQGFCSNLDTIKENWRPHWNSPRLAKDFFHHYLIDQTAAEHAWTLVEEDIFVITDKKRQVVFANLEKAGELLFGKEAMEVLVRCLDMWKFFSPLPAPESWRHVVDNLIRRQHSELDPSAVTIEHLANAVMAVAHYGCWSHKLDSHGKKIMRTMDAKFGRTPLAEYPNAVFPDFAKAALGMASKITRFLTKPLDPEYYEDCVKIFQNLPELARLSTDKEDFISLFAFGANGYTQRHRDVKDISGGLAGLFSTGDYQGDLDHLVRDFTGTRYFIIATNHESSRQYALRQMGDPRAQPLPAPKPKSDSPQGRDKRRASDEALDFDTDELSEDSDDGGDFEAPCINHRTDEDDMPVYTNKDLHGPNVLYSSSSSEASSLD